MRITGSRCSRSINAESLIDELFGFIRDIIEQKAEITIFFSIFVKKERHIESICPEVPVHPYDGEEPFCKCFNIGRKLL